MQKILQFSLLILWPIFPIILCAQENMLTFSADTVQVKDDDFLYAEGNVILNHGQIKIITQSLSYDQKSNILKLGEILQFNDYSGTKISAKNGQLNTKLEDGIIEVAKIVLNEQIKIHANSLNIKNGEIDEITGISRVTSCNECEGKQPKWHFKSASAKRDLENEDIIYRNVSLRFRGVPVIYFPYLRLPDPNVTRARGFLVPEAVLTSNLGTGLKLPYFIPTGSSSDILVTPYISSKTKTLEYRYRKKIHVGSVTLKGAFSEDILNENDLRYFSQLIGSLKLGFGIDLNFNLGKASDNSYLGDYVYSDKSDFNSEISLGKTVVEKDQFFEGNLRYLREKEKTNSLNEYYSFSGSYSRDITPPNLSGSLRLSANLNSSINVNDDNSISRPPSSAQVEANYNQQNFLGPMQLSTELFGNINSFVNSADALTTNEEFSSKYGALASISLPQILRGKGKVGFLSPRLSLSFNGQENDILGDYFIGADELSWGNVYSNHKIMSLTESETGLSISLGLDNKIYWQNGQRLDIAFAASKINGLTYSPAASLGLTKSKINYLGKLSFQNKDAFGVSTNTLFSSNGQLLKGDLEGRYAYKKINLKGNYEFLNHAFDTRLSKNLKTINFESSYNFWDDLKISADGRYDLIENKMAKTSLQLGFAVGAWAYEFNQEYLKDERDKFSMSAIYDDECTRLTFSFENRYRDVGSSLPIKSLALRVQLKPFANVVFSQGTDQITF